ncbi:MAG: ROK family protein [Muribaculaceae bacterium]|nr:ROK family protein [Muribaculaceae bacterium]
MYQHDNRIVVTLDAGGTNLVFGAMKACEFVGSTITLPSNSADLDECLATIVKGFRQIIDSLSEAPVAISFAFPGPADYANGIIGGHLPNFPSFRDGVALGPFLSKTFGLPVFINNDGDLFAFGEATAGALPYINKKVAESGSDKKYKNLLGYTFGTGFGIGQVVGGNLNLGNNSCIETFCLDSYHHNGIMAEEYCSIRAVVREYAALSGQSDESLTPRDICEIADGKRDGDQEAAREAFARLGRQAGDSMATAVTLTDSLIVIGGGLTGAAHLIMPHLLKELRSTIKSLNGEEIGRLQLKVFNLDDEAELEQFIKGDARKLKVYGYDDVVTYDPMKRTGVMISKLGASKAISIGAYTYALSQLDKK